MFFWVVESHGKQLDGQFRDGNEVYGGKRDAESSEVFRGVVGMIRIQVQVGSWSKLFVVLHPKDEEEVGRVVGAVVGYMLHILGESQK